MSTIQELETQRNAVLAEIIAIRSMKRGTINEQFLKVPRKGKREPALRGPYYVLSRKEGRRTVSQRLKSPTELEQAQRDVAAHKRFVELCRQFEQLTEQLGELERRTGDTAPEKKRRRSRSSKTRK